MKDWLIGIGVLLAVDPFTLSLSSRSLVLDEVSGDQAASDYHHVFCSGRMGIHFKQVSIRLRGRNARALPC